MRKKKNKILYYNTFEGGGTANTIGSIGGALTGIIGGAVNNAQLDKDYINTVKSGITTSNKTIFDPSSNDELMDQFSMWNPLQNVNSRDLKGSSTGQQITNTLGGTAQGAMSGFTVGGPVGAIIGGGIGLLGGLGGIFVGNSKAKREASNLNKKIDRSNNFINNSFDNAINRLDTQADLNMLANYAAYGGNLMFDGGYTHGANWDNGVNIIKNGGTHNENSMGGIPMGMDEQGIPNLVEEGEVKWNNYIFSNRLKAKEKDLENMNIPKRYAKKTYAEIAKSLSKESEERPNDPISKNGIDSYLTKLAQLQEDSKMKKQQRKSGNIFAKGGPFTNPTLRQNINGVIPKYSDITMNQFVPESNSTNSGMSNLSYLRYAPILGSGINALTDAFGVTNKPDYTNADMIGKSVDNLQNIDYNPIGDYMTYNPLDRNYYQNMLNSQTGATRRNIINQSGGNRATATAGLLAADYNATGATGKLAREAEEYNLNQRQKVSEFNRGTNMFNTESAMRVAQINKMNDEYRMRAKMAEAEMRNREDMISAQAKSANLTNLFNSLGDVGREEFSRNMLLSNPALYYTIDSRGNITYKNTESLTSDQLKQVQTSAEKEASEKKNTYKKVD